MWETEPAPAAITAFGIPDMQTHTTNYAIKIPWVMGLIGTRSIDEQIPGAIVTVIGPPPVSGLGSTGGFKLIIEDRSGGNDINKLQKMTDAIKEFKTRFVAEQPVAAHA